MVSHVKFESFSRVPEMQLYVRHRWGLFLRGLDEEFVMVPAFRHQFSPFVKQVWWICLYTMITFFVRRKLHFPLPLLYGEAVAVIDQDILNGFVCLLNELFAFSLFLNEWGWFLYLVLKSVDVSPKYSFVSPLYDTVALDTMSLFKEDLFIQKLFGTALNCRPVTEKI